MAQYVTYQVRRRVSNQSRLNQQRPSQHSFLYCEMSPFIQNLSPNSPPHKKENRPLQLTHVHNRFSCLPGTILSCQLPEPAVIAYQSYTRYAFA